MKRIKGFISATSVLLVVALLLPIRGTRAATFVVDSPADSHDILPGDGICGDNVDPDSSRCTFRAAVEEADAYPGPDTVLLSGDTLIVYLELGSIALEHDNTSIVGSDGYPIIDGVANPPSSDVLVIQSDSNVVRGVTIRRSRRHGIRIEGLDNVIGGDTPEARVVLIGNGVDNGQSSAITILGGVGNQVSGCYVGVYGNGAEFYANRNGILLGDSASANVIGGAALGNIISGNSGFGVVVSTSAHDNQITGNLIGPDITKKSGPGNLEGGILIDDHANRNSIGDGSTEGMNIVSGNSGDGIEIRGTSTRANSVIGNYIGVDVSGYYSLANLGNGITIADGATSNLIGDGTDPGRNIISGNAGDGVHIAGAATTDNVVTGNYIGAGRLGGGLVGGDAVSVNGVVIADGAYDNTVGGVDPVKGNLVSANRDAGILISGAGTRANHVIGNYIGVSVNGISSVPNGSGVVVLNGASANVIGGPGAGEGNLISGNRADVFPFGGGVLIYGAGSNGNVVQGNYIGTDVDGTRPLRNGSSGVMIGSGAKFNLIGGSDAGEGNIISGNGSGDFSPTLARGVYIYGEGTESNVVSGNLIGLSSVDTLAVPNMGHGVGITDGARLNTIGGTSLSEGNIIAGNAGFGLYIAGPTTERNTARYNNFIDNDSVAIVIRNGAQGGIQPPIPDVADDGYLFGAGVQPGARVDAYLTWSEASGFYEGTKFLGSTLAMSTGGFIVLLNPRRSVGDSVSAIVTDTLGNSSAFAANTVVLRFVDVADTSSSLPFTFSLGQNYPNPFNPTTSISYSLPRASMVCLTVVNILGQEVVTLQDSHASAGQHSVVWDGVDRTGEPVASGVYFYRLVADSLTATRKMLLLK